MDEKLLFVGLLCSDADFVEYYVQLITKVKRFILKAIWCPDTERSIQVAADNDVPSVSHTAFQLISRNDTNAVIIAGHVAHNALFCMQTQALKKKAICIGATALSQQTAQLLAEFSEKHHTLLRVIYALKYSPPISFIKANFKKIGVVQSINVEANFREPQDVKHRLYNDCNTMLHQEIHGIIAALSEICGCHPIPVATTCHQQTSLVEHFRLQELKCVHMQVVFGTTVANIRIAAHSSSKLVLRIVGERGFFQFDPRALILESPEGQGVLWRGDGTMETIISTGLIKAFESCDSDGIADLSESILVDCVSVCRFI